jgi:hypothetical protein
LCESFEEDLNTMAAGKATKRRQALLVSILVIVCLLWLGHQIDEYLLAAQVKAAAADDIAEDVHAGARTASLITVSRDPLFIGTPTAKVEVFIAGNAPDRHRPQFSIEYHFAREASGWELQDSGTCYSDTCMDIGEELLEQTEE